MRSGVGSCRGAIQLNFDRFFNDFNDFADVKHLLKFDWIASQAHHSVVDRLVGRRVHHVLVLNGGLEKPARREQSNLVKRPLTDKL